MMKHLAAMNVVLKKGPDTYALLALGRALTSPVFRDGIIIRYVTARSLLGVSADGHRQP